jgi:hypothetical protein
MRIDIMNFQVMTMQIQFKRNIQFTKHFKASGRVREFNFRKIPGIADDLFHVDVSDERGNRIMFRMQKDKDQWKIVDQQLPQWIKDAEPGLHELIEEELQLP